MSCASYNVLEKLMEKSMQKCFSIPMGVEKKIIL